MVELALVIGSPERSAQWSQLLARTAPETTLEAAASQELGPTIAPMLDEVVKDAGMSL